jgi:hypothetical protein
LFQAAGASKQTIRDRGGALEERDKEIEREKIKSKVYFDTFSPLLCYSSLFF